MSPCQIASQEIASIQIPLHRCDSSETTSTTTRKSKPPPAWTYQGYSRAGAATSFELVEPKWTFDCGSIISDPVKSRPSCIFITHTHADHIQSLHQLLFSQKPIIPPPPPPRTDCCSNNTWSTTVNANTIHVYFPAAAESHLRNFLQSYYELIRDTMTMDDDSSVVWTMEQLYNFQLHPVQVNDEFTVTASSSVISKDIEYVVRIVQCVHRKVCIGYSIFQRQRILIEPFRSMTGIELGNYIKANKSSTTGISNISHMKEWSPVLHPIFCFLGDTTTQVFAVHPEILQEHRFIAIECTYYYGTSDDESTNIHQHTFWEVLRTNVLLPNPNVMFLLQHFSNRHRRHEWIQWMYNYNQDSGHYNVHPMLHRTATPPTVNNTTLSVSDGVVTKDRSEMRTTTTVSVHPEVCSVPILSTLDISTSCNCFLCQPTGN